MVDPWQSIHRISAEWPMSSLHSSRVARFHTRTSHPTQAMMCCGKSPKDVWDRELVYQPKMRGIKSRQRVCQWMDGPTCVCTRPNVFMSVLEPQEKQWE